MTFEVLFKAYSWVYRSGLLEQVKRLASTALLGLFPSGRDRELIRRAMKTAGATDLFVFLQQAALAFAKASLHEDLGQGKASLEQQEEQMLGARSDAEPLEELAEEGGGAALFGHTVSLYVSQQTWESVVQLKEELGTSSNDEALRTLYRAYDWYYYNDPSPLMDEVEHLASTALSCLHLDADQQALIKQAMKYENATDLFDFLQELVLGYGECIVEEGQQKEQ